MTACTSGPVNTFSVGFDRYRDYNELQQAQRVAKYFKTNHHEVVISHRDVLEYMPALVRSQDEPMSDWVCVPLYFLSRLARNNGVTVVQVGEGADELFCGYPGYLKILRRQQRLWPLLRHVPNRWWSVGAGVAAAFERAGLEQSEGLKRRLRRLADEDGRFWGGAVVLRGADKEELLRTPFWRSQVFRLPDSRALPRRVYNQVREKNPSADLLEIMTYIELKQRLPELLLMRVDKITMSASIEARVPSLDHKLDEFAISIPMEAKIRGWQTKPVLKRAAESLLPPDIVHRPKQGFSAPVAQWFREELASECRRVVLDGRIHERAYFNRDFIRRMLDRHQDGRSDHAVPLWNLYNLALWYEAWF